MDNKKNKGLFGGKKKKSSQNNFYSNYNQAAKNSYNGPAGAYSEVVDALDSKKQIDIYSKGKNKQPNQYSNKQPNQYQSGGSGMNNYSNKQPNQYQSGGSGMNNYSNKQPNQYQSGGSGMNNYSNKQPNQYQSGDSGVNNYSNKQPNQYSNKQPNQYQNDGMNGYSGAYSETKIYPDVKNKYKNASNVYGDRNPRTKADPPDPGMGGYGVKKSKYNNNTNYNMNPKSAVKNYGQDKYGDGTLYGDDVEDCRNSKK